jgi:hypothetical protein
MAQARPTIRSALVFHAKVLALQTRRFATDLKDDTRSLGRGAIADFPVTLAESRTPLWSDTRPEERKYQLGKVQNLRIAVTALNRRMLPAGDVFSFWKQVGRATAYRGFVEGRMLQEGCLVPATGGGLCQLSNALYDVALRAGTEIVERHAHSRVVPGSAAVGGRDATVAWNYVDLRWRADQDLLIEARLDGDALLVRLRGRAGSVSTAVIVFVMIPNLPSANLVPRAPTLSTNVGRNSVATLAVRATKAMSWASRSTVRNGEFLAINGQPMGFPGWSLRRLRR